MYQSDPSRFEWRARAVNLVASLAVIIGYELRHSSWWGYTFRRDTEATGVNTTLNYGYAVIRALVARAVVSSGLHPSLGLHHSNQYNGLALADDLMEPFRPWVDLEIYLMTKGDISIGVNKATKQALLGLMSKRVELDGKIMPLMVACHQFTSSLKAIYERRAEKLSIPTCV